MELRLALPYRLKQGEEFQFLEPHENEGMAQAVVSALEELPAGTPNEKRVLAASAARRAYIAEPEITDTVSARISAFLIREAVALKYKKDNRLEIPRKGENKSKPGVWYGKLVEQMEDYPPKLDVSAEIAVWLVAVWQDDKVQNGFAPNLQAWVNVMDEEFERLSDELKTVKSGETKETK